MTHLIFVCAFAISSIGARKLNAKEPQVGIKEAGRQIAVISSQNHRAVFQKVEGALRAETRVPPRWPSFIPNATDKDHVLYVDFLMVTQDSYDIEIGWSQGCIGGNVCHFGTVRGSVQAPAEETRPDIPIQLQHNIKGYFINFTCGAHCDDATVRWIESGYYYSISLKAGKKHELIEMANSAIASVHSF